MNGTILEKDLHHLRGLIANLYGEDIAQDTMVRILSREYKENWFKQELWQAKRQWQRHQAREKRLVPFDEEISGIIAEDDTDRMFAWIELEKGSRTSLAFLQLILIELGIRPTPHGETIRRLREKSR